MATKTPRTWNQLKSIVEYSRKFIYSINNDVPSSIKFREYVNPETGQNEYRIYFLASNQKREITIKYVTVDMNKPVENRLVGKTMFEADYLQGPTDKKLTKEEQLLRERKRCSFSGITQYSLNNNGRFLFSERSDLFYLDDQILGLDTGHPMEIKTFSKGAIDVKICPHNSNLISYVLEDNIWIQDLTTKQEIKLTDTSEPFKSGVPSYAVQEEFDRYSGYWWCPNKQTNADGSFTYRILYEETDESLVELTYITPSCTGDAGYDEYRYPRAGTPNSKVYLKMVEFTIQADKTEPVKIIKKRMNKNFYELFNWFEYLTRAEFTPDGKNFWVEIYDRLQCHTANLLVPLDYFIIDQESDIDMQSGETRTPSILCFLEQTSDTWINAHNLMSFLNESTDTELSFLTANEESGFLHLYYYKISLEHSDFTQLTEGVLKSVKYEKRQLTSGNWCVDADQSLTVDEKNNLVYFHAYQEPTECQFFVIDYSNPNKIKQLTNSGFTNHVAINQQANIFIATRSNLSTPSKAFIYEIKNQEEGVDKLSVNQIAQMIGRDLGCHNQSSQAMGSITPELNFSSILMNNVFNLNMESFLLTNDNESSLVEKFFRPPEIFNFMTQDNCKLYGMIYMPFNYVKGQTYPTLLHVYAGPRAQLVTNSYKINKFSRLNILSLLNYCVVVIDSRGSNNRGLEFEAYLKHRMGTVEIDDQVQGLMAASRMFECIDLKRVAIFGWSYGGYMALMGLAQRPDIFKVAVSGAPVTTWDLYDTAYTERYMSLPELNKEGYDNGSVINLAKEFPDEENRLLIIHGMIDENVHFVHTRKFIDSLIKEGKPYRLQIYPNERHGIRSPDSSVHCDLNLYSFLENYL